MAEGFHIYTGQLRELGRDLTRAGEALAIQLPKAAYEGAEVIADAARDIVRSYPASGDVGGNPSGGQTREDVASSIHVVPETAKAQARVQAGGPGMPMAGLWELGNKRSDPKDTTFRHPVYGHPNIPWQTQPKWPYLRMAVRRTEAEVFLKVESSVAAVFAPAFHGANVSRGAGGRFVPMGSA